MNRVERLKSGEREVFKELFDAYSTDVFRLCLRMTGNRQEAEDIAQDVFLKAYEGIGSFRGESRISTWLYRICVNLYLNHKRRKITEEGFRKAGGRGEEGREVPIREEGSGLPGGNPVNEAIDSLPGRQRTAVILNHFAELSYRETASVMGLSEASVRSLLFRAKKRLQRTLESILRT